jgi:hypothetical protein
MVDFSQENCAEERLHPPGARHLSRLMSSAARKLEVEETACPATTLH